MKKIALYLILIIVAGCSRGIWVTQNAYRPKHPNFSILKELKEPYSSNELIDYNSLYISTKGFVNYDGNIVLGYMGFYNDGRMIVDNTWKNEMHQILNKRNSYETASSIGYYIINRNTIRMEYFLPGDGGHYEIRQGLIKKDTIILSDKFTLLFKKDIRSDTLVKSTFLLR